MKKRRFFSILISCVIALCGIAALTACGEITPSEGGTTPTTTERKPNQNDKIIGTWYAQPEDDPEPAPNSDNRGVTYSVNKIEFLKIEYNSTLKGDVYGARTAYRGYYIDAYWDRGQVTHTQYPDGYNITVAVKTSQMQLNSNQYWASSSANTALITLISDNVLTLKWANSDTTITYNRTTMTIEEFNQINVVPANRNEDGTRKKS